MIDDISILYEDNHIIAVNKKTSDIVQSDKTNDLSLSKKLKIFIKKKYFKKGNVFLGIVHRIDRPVSGVVLFAKTSKSLSRLNKLFKERDIEKTYFALVKKCPKKEEGTLKHFIYRNRKQNKSYSYDKEIANSKMAIMHYYVKKKIKNKFLLEINLETGRHHQIRSQLSKIGSPIIGDVKYGFSFPNKNLGISLHSKRIKFIHPVKKEEIEIIANLPKNFF